MPDDAFARGLAELERYCGGLEGDGPIDELVAVFVFAAPADLRGGRRTIAA